MAETSEAPASVATPEAPVVTPPVAEAPAPEAPQAESKPDGIPIPAATLPKRDSDGNEIPVEWGAPKKDSPADPNAIAEQDNTKRLEAIEGADFTAYRERIHQATLQMVGADKMKAVDAYQDGASAREAGELAGMNAQELLRLNWDVNIALARMDLKDTADIDMPLIVSPDARTVTDKDGKEFGTPEEIASKLGVDAADVSRLTTGENAVAVIEGYAGTSARTLIDIAAAEKALGAKPAAEVIPMTPTAEAGTETTETPAAVEAAPAQPAQAEPVAAEAVA